MAPDSRFQKIISGNLSPKMVEFNPENSVTSESPHDDIVVLEQVPVNTANIFFKFIFGIAVLSYTLTFLNK